MYNLNLFWANVVSFFIVYRFIFQYLLQPKYKLEEKARQAVGLGACSEIKENILYLFKIIFGLLMYSETECIYRFLSNTVYRSISTASL